MALEKLYCLRRSLAEFFNTIGQEEAFPPHRPNAGYVIGKETVAWARGSERDAPKAVLPANPRVRAAWA